MIHLRRVTLHPEDYPTTDHYPFNLPIFRATPALDFATPVTIFVGENGSGKSTLLKAIARRCGITIWEGEGTRRAEYNPYEEALPLYLEVDWTAGSVPGSFFAAQIFQHFAETLDVFAAIDPGQLNYFGGHSLMTLSHGQSLMSFFKSRYQIRGLYLLDEPEAALSPKSQMELAAFIHAMAAAGHAQFLICTHSPILLACPGATLYSFDSAPIAPTTYEDTTHYQLYKQFMDEPGKCFGDRVIK
ncbi:MAG: AAA family ATPase [Armatimonadota bacterium]